MPAAPGTLISNREYDDFACVRVSRGVYIIIDVSSGVRVGNDRYDGSDEENVVWTPRSGDDAADCRHDGADDRSRGDRDDAEELLTNVSIASERRRNG